MQVHLVFLRYTFSESRVGPRGVGLNVLCASVVNRILSNFVQCLFAFTLSFARLTLTPPFSSLLLTSRKQILYFTART